MRKLNSKGFSVVELLLIILVVVVLGGIGYMIYSRQNKVTTKTETTAPVAKPEPVADVPDPTADWKMYTSTSGKFTVKYPSTWVTATNPEFCAEGVFLIGANADSVGRCGSDGFGQMSIYWRSDIAVCNDFESEAWKQDSKESVMISGVQGIKLTGTAIAPTYGIGLPGGTKSVRYCVVKNGMTYTADYDQISGYPDVLADFNTMVLKTFKIQ